MVSIEPEDRLNLTPMNSNINRKSFPLRKHTKRMARLIEYEIYQNCCKGFKLIGNSIHCFR